MGCHFLLHSSPAAAVAAKSLQSCLTLRPHGLQPTRLLRPWDSPGNNTGVGCHFILQCMKVENESEVTQSCTTLSNLMDCSLPGSSVRGIFQAIVNQCQILSGVIHSEFGITLVVTPFIFVYCGKLIILSYLNILVSIFCFTHINNTRS